jgi:hypothetical protein
MDITMGLIKSIKNAIVENNIEISVSNYVMWDVCKKEYKFFIGDLAPFFYKFPDGMECTNFNPSYSTYYFMNLSDIDCYNTMINDCYQRKEELENMVKYYNDCK